MRTKDFNRGYSLSEVLVVMALISTIAVISGPALIGQMSHIRLKRAARDVTAELNAARFKAIAQNARYRVEFTLYASASTPDAYSLSSWNAGTSAWEDYPTRPRRELPANTNITSPGESFNVEFRPNGTSTGAAICIQNTSETSDRMKLTVSTSTGQIVISTGC